MSSNGYTGVVLDLDTAVIHHFREHVYATEEPVWAADGTEVWEVVAPGSDCYKPLSVYSRDLLRDAYFGVGVGETSFWLNGRAVDLDASGYDGFGGAAGREGASP